EKRSLKNFARQKARQLRGKAVPVWDSPSPSESSSCIGGRFGWTAKSAKAAHLHSRYRMEKSILAQRSKDAKVESAKHEIRISKSETNSNVQSSNFPNKDGSIQFWIFFIFPVWLSVVSKFELRISNLYAYCERPSGDLLWRLTVY